MVEKEAKDPSIGGGGALGFGVIAAIAIAIWFFAGFYTIGEAERGVVLRLGKYDRVVDPGLNWRPRFIDEVTKRLTYRQFAHCVHLV